MFFCIWWRSLVGVCHATPFPRVERDGQKFVCSCCPLSVLLRWISIRPADVFLVLCTCVVFVVEVYYFKWSRGTFKMCLLCFSAVLWLASTGCQFAEDHYLKWWPVVIVGFLCVFPCLLYARFELDGTIHKDGLWAQWVVFHKDDSQFGIFGSIWVWGPVEAWPPSTLFPLVLSHVGGVLFLGGFPMEMNFTLCGWSTVFFFSILEENLFQ